jgi:hypothetical protein
MRIDISTLDAVLLSPDKERFAARRKHTLQTLSLYGIEPVWFKSVEHENPRISAALSVVEICQRSLASSKPLLFLEDDLTSWNPNTLFDIPDDADLLRLGISRVHTTEVLATLGHLQSVAYLERVNDSLYESKCMYATHAIVCVTERGKRALLESAMDVVEGRKSIFDETLAFLSFFSIKTYALSWPVFYQDNQFQKDNERLTKVTICGPLLISTELHPFASYYDRETNLTVHMDGIAFETASRDSTHCSPSLLSLVDSR